jgi:hypothetical protein
MASYRSTERPSSSSKLYVNNGFNNRYSGDGISGEDGPVTTADENELYASCTHVACLHSHRNEEENERPDNQCASGHFSSNASPPINRSAIIDTVLSSQDIDDVLDTFLSRGESAVVYPSSTGLVKSMFNQLLLLHAFPWLFPYGIGNLYRTIFSYFIEGHDFCTRPVSLSLGSSDTSQWVRGMLLRGDKRFVADYHFIFVIYNMLQRRDLCASVGARISRTSGTTVSSLYHALTDATLDEAIKAKNEGRTLPSNHVAMKFMREVNYYASTVRTSDEYKMNFRRELQSLRIANGGCTWFVTFSPADLHHPAGLIFTQNINVDELVDRSMVTSYADRARAGANDPVALTKFFHAMLELMTTVIFGYDREQGGVFGHIKSYYGVVEDQNRGSLHCHFLLWLPNAITGAELYERMSNDEAFSRDYITYVDGVVSCRFDQHFNATYSPDDDPEWASKFDKHKNAATQNMPDPRNENYSEQRAYYLWRLVQTAQMHMCNLGCFKYAKVTDAITICRMRYPRTVCECTHWESDTGVIKYERVNERVTQHNESISLIMSANNDVQDVPSGPKADSVIYYLTSYVTKARDLISNIFVLYKAAIASLISYPMAGRADFTPPQNEARNVIIRTCSTKFGQRQTSACITTQYLLGLPDHVTNERFENLVVRGLTRRLAAKCHARHQESILMADSVADPDCERPHADYAAPDPKSTDQLENDDDRQSDTASDSESSVDVDSVVSLHSQQRDI